MNRTFAAALCVLGLGLSGPAFAASTNDPAHGDLSVVVSYADLDLTSEAGARAMLDRVTAAASKVCGRRTEYIENAVAARNACRKVTVDAAVARLANTNVTRVHAGGQLQPGVRLTAR
jgi:UrcA family protein